MSSFCWSKIDSGPHNAIFTRTHAHRPEALTFTLSATKMEFLLFRFPLGKSVCVRARAVMKVNALCLLSCEGEAVRLRGRVRLTQAPSILGVSAAAVGPTGNRTEFWDSHWRAGLSAASVPPSDE